MVVPLRFLRSVAAAEIGGEPELARLGVYHDVAIDTDGRVVVDVPIAVDDYTVVTLSTEHQKIINH